MKTRAPPFPGRAVRLVTACFVLLGVHDGVLSQISVEMVALTGRQAPGTEPGVSFASFERAIINDSGTILFSSRLEGPGVDPGNDTALCLLTDSGFQLLARAGGPAPGFGPEARFERLFRAERNVGRGIDTGRLFALNNAGRFVFAAEAAGPGLECPATLGIWTGTSPEDMTLFLRGGTPGPAGFPGATYGDATFGYNLHGRDAPDFNPRSVLRLDDADRIAFTAYLEGPRALEYPTRDGWNGTSAILTGSVTGGAEGLVPVLQTGDPVPGTDELIGPLNWLFAGFSMNSSGTFSVGTFITFNGQIGHDGSSPFRYRWTTARAALLLASVENGIRLVGASGLPAPGLEGERFGIRVGDSVVNEAGVFLFSASIGGTGTRDDEDGLWWAGSAGGFTLIARQGDPAPGTPEGAVFSRISGETSINRHGRFAFRGRVAGEGVDDSNDAGIWTGTGPDDVVLAVREGDEAPGVPGAVLARPGPARINDQNRVFFRSRLDVQSGRSLWVVDPLRGLELIVRPGDVLPAGPDDFRTVEHVSLSGILLSRDDTSRGDDGKPRIFTDTGLLVFYVTFTDGTSGIAIARLDGCDRLSPDTAPPIITLPADIALETTDAGGEVVEFSALVRDNCDPDPELTYTPEPGSLFPAGTTTVVCTATDSRGNRAVSSFRVTVTLDAAQLPGDCTQDGDLDISDGLCVLGVLFRGAPARLPCASGSPTDESNLALIDFNGDNRIDLSDAVSSFQHLFAGGPPHASGTACVPIAGCGNVCGA